jgi:AbrB family looped-hinge helix DNA binding protein
MQTRVSSKGQIVLPGPLRRKLGIRAGDVIDVSLDASVGAGEPARIFLTPQRQIKHEAKIVIDPITGLPVLTAGPGAPILTSEEVAEMLVDFP